MTLQDLKLNVSAEGSTKNSFLMLMLVFYVVLSSTISMKPLNLELFGFIDKFVVSSFIRLFSVVDKI